MIEIGNVYRKKNADRGWIVGDFAHLEGTPFHTKAFEMKWSSLHAGDRKESPPTLDGNTVTILVTGEIEIRFADRTETLTKEGDYAYWDPGISHTWEAKEDSLVVTLRWPAI